MMHPSETAYSLVEASEGRQYASYIDGGGHATGGIGHKLDANELSIPTPYTDQQIDNWFYADMEEAAEIVRKYVTVPLNQGQFDALVSFAFNFGETKFASYTLLKLINGGNGDDAIGPQWMKYIYTIHDRDRDGDADAVIDRGLPIRRLREWLIWRGFSWTVAEQAANPNNVKPDERQIDWRGGGFKEVIDDVIALINEVVDRARSLAAFLDEPDDDLFKEEEVTPPANQDTFEELEIPKRGAEPVAEQDAIFDPTPETPLTTEDLNTMQAESLRTGKPMSFERPIMPVGEKPMSVNTRAPEEVPYGIDGERGLVPKEETRRYQGGVLKEKGISMQETGTKLTVATGVVAGANAMSEEVRSLSANLGTVGLTLLGVAFGLGILWMIWGKIRKERGERLELEGEIDATQGMY